MRFVMMVRATKETEAGMRPTQQLLDEMGAYHEELAKAGVLIDGAGLKPSAQGFRVRYSGGKKTIVDGPFAEAKELIAGFTIINVQTREEALDWARRFPNPLGEGGEAEVEVRPLYEEEDFAPGGGMSVE